MLLVKHLKHKLWTKCNTHAGSILSSMWVSEPPIILSEHPTVGLNGHQHQQNQHQQTETFVVPRTHDVSSEAKSNCHATTESICPRKSLSKCHWPYLATLCHNPNGGWTYSWGSKKKSDQERENHMATRATSWKDLPCQKWPRVYKPSSLHMLWRELLLCKKRGFGGVPESSSCSWCLHTYSRNMTCTFMNRMCPEHFRDILHLANFAKLYQYIWGAKRLQYASKWESPPGPPPLSKTWFFVLFQAISGFRPNNSKVFGVFAIWSLCGTQQMPLGQIHLASRSWTSANATTIGRWFGKFLQPPQTRYISPQPPRSVEPCFAGAWLESRNDLLQQTWKVIHCTKTCHLA